MLNKVKFGKTKLLEPLVFVYHINWKLYENFGNSLVANIDNLFRVRGVTDFNIIPILTDNNTYMDNRVKQLKPQIERLCDSYNKKLHLISYSFTNLVVKNYISAYNGEDYISSVLTVGSPNKGCRLMDLLQTFHNNDKFGFVEPSLRGIGLNLDWARREYNTAAINVFNKTNSLKNSIKVF